MFTKLRNRFLILNLIIISVMMLFAFSSIYLITYKNVHDNINMELNRISEFNRKPDIIPGQPQPSFDNAPPRERSVSFTILTDSNWNTLFISSIFDMDEEFYDTAKNNAVSQNTRTGEIKLDGNYWAFIIKPAPDGYRLAFLDITPRQGILTNLVYTFLVVASVMLIFIFFISRFFANKAIKPVKEAFDKQKQFIADASHELKTPLTVINTNVDVLLSNGDANINSQSKWLHYIKSEVERMAKLTGELLYLTQLDYSDAGMIYSDFDLSETVENVILTMEAVIFENNLTFKYDVESSLIFHGNSEQLKQVVMILLDNAVKYASSKGMVSIALKKNNNNISLSVANTGEGISEEQINKIFDRFYRTDKSRTRKSGGYGLGLSIAKSIIEQHGGKISAKSNINEGTTFIVELPRSNRQ
ncbi:MAG: histidine kinase [Clostridia bacterium BRH_c25]|nr:MAG: histidine kinase [Clostridia bacterium BRH_c25]